MAANGGDGPGGERSAGAAGGRRPARGPAPTADGLARNFLAERVPPALVARGAGAQRSDLVRHLFRRWLVHHWPPTAGRVPRPTEPLTPARAAVVAALLAAHEALLVAAVAAVVDVARGAAAALRIDGRSASPAELSEPATALVTDHVLRHGAAPESAAVQTLVAAAVARRAGRGQHSLSGPAFARRYGPVYDRLWEECGAAALASHPPSRLGLGADRRPPLLTPPGTPANWLCGSDLSVYARYRRGGKLSAETRAHPRRRHVCPADGPGPQVDPGAAVVAAACAPYGLRHAEHRRILTAFELALDWAEPAPTAAAWEQWSAAACDEVGAPQTLAPLVAAIRSRLAIWRRGPAARELAAVCGPLESHLELIGRAVIRKAWTELQRREREHARPARRCHVATIVRVVVDVGIAAGLPPLLAGAVGPLPATVDAPDPWAEQDARVRATYELLAEQPAVGRAYLADEPGWSAKYERLAPATHGPGWGTVLLSVDELLARRGTMMPDGDQDDDD